MVTELKEQQDQEEQERTLTRADVVARVQEKIDAGETPNAAFSLVFDDIVNERLLEALVALHGADLVGRIWRTWNMANRPAAILRTLARPVQPSPVVRPARQPLGPPPPPVHDLAPLLERPLLNGLWKLGDEWVRLGDMDNGTCHKVFEQYRKAALGKEHYAQFFRALEAGLGDGAKVEDKYDDALLIRLFKRTKPVSRQVPVS
jgi:hypothetical protein